MSKFLAVLISVAVIATSFTSAAEAGPGRRLGFFLGGMAPASMLAHAAEERRREEAYERMRARREAAARERARQRAIAAAAAKRERARQIALQKQKAAQIAAAEAAQKSATPSDDDKPALKKGDRLTSSDGTPANTTADGTAQTTTIEKTPSSSIETSSTTTTDAATTTVTCRKYSAAADSVIDAPCQ